MAQHDVVAQAAENMATHMTWVHERVPGMTVRRDPHLILADSALATDTWNTISRARLESNTSSRIREAIDYFTTRQRAFSWWVGPGDSPSDLEDGLRMAGLTDSESEVAMAADLAALPAHPHLPDRLVIQRVRTVQQLEEFARINAENWEPPDADVLTFYRQAAGALLDDACPLWFYVGLIDQRSVATAQITVSGASAGLYNVSTRAGYRRRGIGMAMTLRSLVDAHDDGLSLGILQAARDGVGVYTRAGFSAFGEYREYKPAGPTP